MEDSLVIINASVLKKVLIGWKILFLGIQIYGMLYCFYIVHKPTTFLKKKKQRTPHPLFSSDNVRTQREHENNDSVTLESTTQINNTVTSLPNARPQSLFLPSENEVHFRTNADNLRQHVNNGYNRNSCYESYQSLTSGRTVETPIRYLRNPAYDSAQSLNHTPSNEQTVHYNRNRLSYVEPICETSGPENGIDYGTIGRT